MYFALLDPPVAANAGTAEEVIKLTCAQSGGESSFDPHEFTR